MESVLVEKERYAKLVELEKQDKIAADKYSRESDEQFENIQLLKSLPAPERLYDKKDFGVDWIAGDLHNIWLSHEYEHFKKYHLYYDFLRNEVLTEGSVVFVGNVNWLPELKRDDRAEIKRYGVTLLLPYTFNHNFDIFARPEKSSYFYLHQVVDCLFNWYK